MCGDARVRVRVRVRPGTFVVVLFPNFVPIGHSVVSVGASILDVGVVSPVRVAIVVWFHLPVAVDWKIVVNHVVRVTKGNVSWVEVSEPPEADNRPLKLLGTASLGESKVLRVAEESGRDERVNVLEVKRLLQALLNRVLYPGV